MAVSSWGVYKQAFAAVSAALSVFIVGCWLGWPSPAVKKILDGDVDIQISPDQISWVVALMDFGNFVSPIPSGYLSDWLGRKRTLMLTAYLFMATWALAIFGTSAPYLFAARFGAGIGKGVVFTAVPMYLGEIAGVQVRGAISTIFTGMFYSGMMFAYCLGPFVTYDTQNYVSGVIPIVFFVTFFSVPESPYFLLMKKRNEEARRSLAWLRHADPSDIEKELQEMSENVRKDMEERVSFGDLISTPGNRKALTIVLVLSALQRLGGISCISAYTAVTLPRTGGYFSPEVYMMVYGAALVVGNVTAAPLIDRAGRKPLLVVSCSSCAVLITVSAVFYWAAGPANDTDHNWIPYFCFALIGFVYALGIGFIPCTFVGELFPTNVKSYASALTAMSFSISSFVTNKSYLYVKDGYGVHYMFIFFSICNILAVVFTVFAVFETKGKSFAQIQDELRGRRQVLEMT